ncbi:Hypothetical Protein FCC1311_024052 [Hondaea fermentalgiana]|uniref:Uncharacterized protein n=1 Tax=Hondaea fermentalgiana TaxID=2315210 RepID=A0A2R5GED6_9STRA|nr:Hypothetical Protein FCC1311_024052 [Hondaea fermentalgiana]|eukprot:GBG26184.1 Hypothetical Protein FCC1311_024052 [Hondaea fermentalgiana]
MFKNTNGYAVHLMFFGMPDHGKLYYVEDRFVGYVEAPSYIEVSTSRNNIMYHQDDADDYALPEGSTLACTKELALDSVRVVRYAYPFSNPLYADSVRLYLCPVAEEDAPKAVSKTVEVPRMVPTLLDIESTDAENFAFGSFQIAFSTVGLHGRLYAHKCPNTIEEEAELAFLPETADQRVAVSQGSMQVCYQSSTNGSIAAVYGDEDVFDFEVMEFSEDGDRVYGDVNFFRTEIGSSKGTMTIQFEKSVKSVSASHVLVQGAQNRTIVLDAVDDQANYRPREMLWKVNASSLAAGRLFDAITHQELAIGADLLSPLTGDSLILEMPSLDFFDVLPSDVYGRSASLALSDSPLLSFTYAAVAVDAELGVEESSSLSLVTVQVEAAPQPLQGLMCPSLVSSAPASTLGLYAPVQGIQVKSHANADVFPVQVVLSSTSSCENTFLRATLSNVTVDFPAASVNRDANANAAVEDFITLRNEGSSSLAWTSHALCIEHGCSSGIWLHGPTTAINAVLDSLEISELCGQGALGVNVTLVDPYEVTPQVSQDKFSCIIQLRNDTTDASSTEDGTIAGDEADSGTNGMPVYGIVAIALASVAVVAKLVLKYRGLICSKWDKADSPV